MNIEHFMHPLSNIKTINGEQYLNSWAVASILTCEIHSKNPVAIKNVVELCQTNNANMLLVGELVKRIQQGDVAAVKQFQSMIQSYIASK